MNDLKECQVEEKDLSEMRVPKYWNQLYIELLANPTDNTQDKDFCAEVGISPSALAQWKAKYRKSIYAEVQKIRSQYINELRNEAYKVAREKMYKDTNALKLVLQLCGDLVERSESKVEMTDNEKLRRIETLRESVKSRQKAWESAGTGPSSTTGSGPGPESQQLGRTDEGTTDLSNGK